MATKAFFNVPDYASLKIEYYGKEGKYIMSIFAIKNNSSYDSAKFFSNDYENFEEITDFSDKLHSKLENVKNSETSDIKKPVAVGASIALAAFTTFAGARGVVSTITCKKLAPNLGVTVETGLKSAANSVKSTADRLSKENAKGFASNVKKYSGIVLGKAESGARSVYNYIASIGVSKEAINPEKANKALSNIVGTSASAAVVYDVCNKDSNGDGVVDIMQKSQNAYTEAKTNYNSAFETANTISELVQLLT